MFKISLCVHRRNQTQILKVEGKKFRKVFVDFDSESDSDTDFDTSCKIGDQLHRQSSWM